MAYFGHVSGGRTVCIHDFTTKYMTGDWAVKGGILKLLIWAYLKYWRLFGRQPYLSVAVTAYLFGFRGGGK